MTVDQERRFFDKVAIDPKTGCWEWTASTRRAGYGQFAMGRTDGRLKVVMSHRATYEMFKGEIPDGLEIDHICFNKVCCNPEHLEAVTHDENVRRAVAAGVLGRKDFKAKTHCIKGHEFDEANTYIKPDGARCCRTCQRERFRRWKARQRKDAA